MVAGRVSTGITGLDKMLQGGIPTTHSVLVTGGPGTGKTLLGMQYLYSGAKAGEKGLFISLEERPERVIENSLQAFSDFKDLKALTSKGVINVLKIEKWTYDQFIENIQNFVTEEQVRRAFVDSLSVMQLYFEKAHEYRKRIFDMMDFLGGINCTTLISQENPSSEALRGRHDIAQFVTDGVFGLYKLEKKEKRVRAIEIIKMRGTEHSMDLVPLAITSSGIKVFEGEKVY